MDSTNRDSGTAASESEIENMSTSAMATNADKRDLSKPEPRTAHKQGTNFCKCIRTL